MNDFTDGTAREFCGTTAVLHQFTSTKAKIDKKFDIQLADLHVLGRVLNKDQQECVTKWRSSAVACFVDEQQLCVDSAPTSKKKTKASSKSKAGNKAEELDDMTRALFERWAGDISGLHFRRIFFCHGVVECANVIACEQSFSYGHVQLSYPFLVHVNFLTQRNARSQTQCRTGRIYLTTDH